MNDLNVIVNLQMQETAGIQDNNLAMYVYGQQISLFLKIRGDFCCKWYSIYGHLDTSFLAFKIYQNENVSQLTINPQKPQNFPPRKNCIIYLHS